MLWAAKRRSDIFGRRSAYATHQGVGKIVPKRLFGETRQSRGFCPQGVLRGTTGDRARHRPW